MLFVGVAQVARYYATPARNSRFSMSARRMPRYCGDRSGAVDVVRSLYFDPLLMSDAARGCGRRSRCKLRCRINHPGLRRQKIG